jgi:hypothetical protein
MAPWTIEIRAGNAKNAGCPCANYHALINKLVGLKHALQYTKNQTIPLYDAVGGTVQAWHSQRNCKSILALDEAIDCRVVRTLFVKN